MADVNINVNVKQNGMDGFKRSFTELNSAIMIAEKAFQLLNQAVQQTVGVAVEYAAQVRDLNRVTGAGVEETSRLIQAADDMTISYGALEQAAKMAAKNGIEFTTESLALLADEYMALNPGQERAAFLLEKFGKQGLEMGKLMEQGGDGVRAASAAIGKNLVLTEKNVKAARQLEIAQDDLSDSVMGAKIAFGNFLIPVLNDAANSFMQLTTLAGGLSDVYQAHEKEVRKTAKSYDEYTTEMIRSGLAAGELEGASVNQAKALLDGSLAAEKHEAILFKLRNELGFVSEATFMNINANQAWMDELDRGGPILEEVTSGLEDVVEEVENFDDKLSGLKDVMGGAVGDELESFKTKMAAIGDETLETQGKIAELEKLKYLTPEQEEELTWAREKLVELGDEATTAAEEHKQAMASIIFDMQAVHAAADGVITEAEYAALQQYATDMGLVDQSTLDAQYALQLLNTEIANNPDKAANMATAMGLLTQALEDGKLEASELEAILKALDEKTFTSTFKLDVKQVGSIPDYADAPVFYHGNNIVYGGAMAQGGTYHVSRPTMFIAGEAGGETVIFAPDGKPQAGGGMTVNFYGDTDAEHAVQRLKILEAFGV